MRCLTYAGETVVTTDHVASALVELTAALARRGLAEAVSIPVYHSDTRARGDAQLVIGVGNDVLSVETDWPEPDPDTPEANAELRRRLERLGAGATPSPRETHYDRVLDEPVIDHADPRDAGAPAPAPVADPASAPAPIPFTRRDRGKR